MFDIYTIQYNATFLRGRLVRYSSMRVQWQWTGHKVKETPTPGLNEVVRFYYNNNCNNLYYCYNIILNIITIIIVSPNIDKIIGLYCKF